MFINFSINISCLNFQQTFNNSTLSTFNNLSTFQHFNIFQHFLNKTFNIINCINTLFSAKLTLSTPPTTTPIILYYIIIILYYKKSVVLLRHIPPIFQCQLLHIAIKSFNTLGYKVKSFQHSLTFHFFNAIIKMLSKTYAFQTNHLFSFFHWGFIWKIKNKSKKKNKMKTQI